jgi:phosphoribosylanthranilate isomerase
VTGLKFCGLTRAEDAQYAAELRASHAGVIFAHSPRQVSIDEANDVLDAAGSSVKRVGVFATRSASEVLDAARRVRLDVLQLHGAPCLTLVPDLRKVFDGEIWSVVAVRGGSSDLSGKALAQASEYSDAVLLDTAVGQTTGGTGRTFDWAAMSTILGNFRPKVPIVVAGGLNAENVRDAIRALQPSIVDVSSGVESAPGLKDRSLMRAFAEAVHSASIV